MSTSCDDTIKELNKVSALLKRGNLRGAFQVIRKASHSSEAIDVKKSELIAIAWAVALRCEEGAASRAYQAKKLGVTLEEIDTAVARIFHDEVPG